MEWLFNELLIADGYHNRLIQEAIVPTAYPYIVSGNHMYYFKKALVV